jgi:3-deoxy-manno-octulosonate cytidylyltransferase (CMP-KDO synthetase)
MSDFLLIIPARYNSKRLPGKPLIDIKGVPMLIRTYNQCKKVVPRSKIFVATDNKKIFDLCKKNNINTIMTSKTCMTGTDRIAEVAKKIKKKFYINVQGDEPICNPKDIKKIIGFAKKYPNVVINGFTEIKDINTFKSPHVPKVIFKKNGDLIYMSRSPIPSNKKKSFIKAWRQVCIYSFPYNSLKIFSNFKKKTPLEKIEDLELNRLVEIGHKVKMVELSNKSIAVDTKSDLKKVRKLIKN